MRLEVHIGHAPIDIMAKGYDAGIGPQDWAAADMIGADDAAPHDDTPITSDTTLWAG